MKLIDIINERELGTVLNDLLEPVTKRPPNDKGPDAIKVQGYVVHGHWRIRPHRNGFVRRRRGGAGGPKQ